LTVRTFPLRVAPIPGEAIDSWLEALAYRHQVALGDVAVSLQLPWRQGAQWVLTLDAQQRADLSAATDVAQTAVKAMTLSHYDGTALSIDPVTRRLERTFPLGNRIWSRYCPQCLAETGGRWQLHWRLGWTFACTRHRCLLADVCPSCTRRQRQWPHPYSRIPQPARCCGTDHGAYCDGELATAPVLRLDRGHPILAAQRTVLAVISDDLAHFGVYGAHSRTARAALGDIKALIVRILSCAVKNGFAALDLGVSLPGYTDQIPTPEVQWRGRSNSECLLPPGVAAEMAIAVTGALTILNAPTLAEAADCARCLVADRPRRAGRGLVGVRAHESDVTAAILVRASKDRLSPYMQMRYRAALPIPGTPDRDPFRIARIAPRIASFFWPAWAARLIPEGRYPALRQVLACAVLLAGTNSTAAEAATALGGATCGPTVVKNLDLLAREPYWEAVSTSITRLAQYFDSHATPIDYERRRSLDYSSLLPDGRWEQICTEAGHRQGFAWKSISARCFLYEKISGAPARYAPRSLTRPDDTGFWYLTRNLPYVLTQSIARHLDEEALQFLSANGIDDEPLTWGPPLELLADLDLPGVDPRLVDIAELHRSAARASGTVASVAAQLGISRLAVQYLLTEHPLRIKDAPIAKPSARRPYSWDELSVRLTRDELHKLYVEQGWTLSAVARRFDTTLAGVKRAAKCYGIPLRQHPRPRQPDPEWLNEQRVTHRRTMKDIGAEIDVNGDTVSRWMNRDGAPTHAETPRTGTGSLTCEAASELVRSETRTSSGRRRIDRFTRVSAYPTLRAAAKDLGVTREALSAQIRTLEHRMGVLLVHRAVSGLPMRPTPDAYTVIDAIRIVTLE